MLYPTGKKGAGQQWARGPSVRTTMGEPGSAPTGTQQKCFPCVLSLKSVSPTVLSLKPVSPTLSISLYTVQHPLNPLKLVVEMTDRQYWCITRILAEMRLSQHPMFSLMCIYIYSRLSCTLHFLFLMQDTLIWFVLNISPEFIEY